MDTTNTKTELNDAAQIASRPPIQAQHSVISFEQLRINRILLCALVQVACQGFLVALSKLLPMIPMFVYELGITILFVKLSITMGLIEKRRRSEWFVGTAVILVLCLVAIYLSSIAGWLEFFNMQQHDTTV